MYKNFDVISTYTRQQAINDGVLADLSNLYPEECRVYRYPVACTETIWRMIETAVDASQGSLKGIVGDLLWMSQKCIVKKLSESTMLFQVGIGRKTHTLKVNVGPGDNMEPVVTIMGETED